MRAAVQAVSNKRVANPAAAGAVVVAALFMGSTLLTPLYELYRARFGLSPLVLVLLYAVYVVGNLLALLFFGRLSDQLGRRPVVLAGLGLATASALLFALGSRLPWLFVARAVNGLAVGVGAGAATAWITEASRPDRREQAASLMTAFNFAGLTVGPVLAGLLVQYAPDPLQLPFAVYAVLLAAVAALVLRARETLRSAPAGGALPWWRPRLRVPRGLRLAFAAPAAAGFVAMSVVGFYAALGPTLIHEALDVHNRALAAAVVAALFAVAAAVIVATRAAAAMHCLRAGLALTPLGLGLMAAAQAGSSVALMLAGTVACGAAAALAYRGSVARVGELAPGPQRAEVVSAYFVCCFLGNALPVIGVGALTQQHGLAFAVRVFAVLLAALALLALAATFRLRGRR
jgi:MFS family permease